MDEYRTKFTEDDRTLLVKHYTFYRKLDIGELEPKQPKYHHFVGVCRGTLAPQNEHEWAYTRFKQACEDYGVDETAVAANGFIFPESDVPEKHVAGALTRSNRACDDCGYVIPRQRLEAVPNAVRCIKCQENSENSSRSSHDSGHYCPSCKKKGLNAKLVWRRPRDQTRSDQFLGCINYPECKYVQRR